MTDTNSDADDSSVTSNWTLTLTKGSRGVDVFIAAAALRTTVANSLRVGAYTTLKSSYAIYEDGVMQMMNSPKPYYGTNVGLLRYYALGGEGGGGAVDITFPTANSTRSTSAGGDAQQGARQGVRSVVYALGDLPGRSSGLYRCVCLCVLCVYVYVCVCVCVCVHVCVRMCVAC